MNSGAKNRVRVASATARTFLTATTVLCTGLAAPAMAQMLPGGGNGTGGGEPTTLTEERPVIDSNGVDLVTGEAVQQAKTLRIGNLSFSEAWTGDLNYSNFNGVLLEGTDKVVIFYDGRSIAFEKDINGNYQPNNNDGEQLYRVGTGTDFLYIDRSGTEHEFLEAPADSVMISNMAANTSDFGATRLATVTRPNGEKLTWHYSTALVTSSPQPGVNCDPAPPFGPIHWSCVTTAYDRAPPDISMTRPRAWPAWDRTCQALPMTPPPPSNTTRPVRSNS